MSRTYASVYAAAWLMVFPSQCFAQATAENQAIRSVEIEGDRARAVTCLATAIAYEAAHEPIEGQQAVAEVVLNRLHHPAFPKSVCGVIFAGSGRRTGCQFSFACDGALSRHMPVAIMAAARAVANAALDGKNPLRVAGATHYHANYVSPYWAPSLIRVARIGAHIFYRGAGSRDQNDVPSPYAPIGEPSIMQLTGQTPTPPLMAASPRPAHEPASFAPWGLLPPVRAVPAG
ncbi:cell wall hydrolase [Sphingomonas sp.]|uniref:cell wall hydrolase n=1 Tax=Sphingomonas sp. TaxID=28214 RepID=UPI0025DB3B17|nr:cell wall hydrolase [Sphingomonas sp.]